MICQNKYKKLKKYTLRLLAGLFVFLFTLLSGGIIAQADIYDNAWEKPRWLIKSKEFYIYSLGEKTEITVKAVSDIKVNGSHVQEDTWHSVGNTKAPTFTIGTEKVSVYDRTGYITVEDVSSQKEFKNEYGFKTYKVTLDQIDITNWTPYLQITTSHNGYTPTGI